MEDQLKDLFKNKLKEIQIKENKEKKDQKKFQNNKYKNNNPNNKNKKDYNNGKPKNNKYQKQNSKNEGFVERRKLTEYEKAKCDKMEAEAGQWLEQNKAEKSDLKVIIKDTKLKLLALTYENYTEIQNEMVVILKKVELDELILIPFMQAILDRAWSQPTYTPLYANLCQKLARESKNFKTHVVIIVSNEYYTAFKEFFDLVMSLEKPDAQFDYEEEKFEKYLKRKNKLLGNIAMIAELYKNGFLPHNIIRYICCNLIHEMTIYHYKMKEFEKQYDVKTEFPFSEEFVEALIKLIDLAGIEMLKKEEKMFGSLIERIEKDKEKIPDIEEKLAEDNKYKQEKIQKMLTYVEKKLGKQPKYISDKTTFPLKLDDYHKFNCINISIEF